MNTEIENLISNLEKLLRIGDYTAVIAGCDRALEKHPRETRFWNMLGVCLGAKKQHRLARTCFVASLSIRFDCAVVVNLVTSNFALGKTAAASKLLDKHFDKLCPICTKNALNSVVEAIREGTLNRDNLPTAVQRLLSKVIIM